jgi:general secretion pathway protein H
MNPHAPTLHDERLGKRRAIRRARARGLTLIEVVIVMVIMALLAGGVAMATGQVARSRLRGSASRVMAALRIGYQRASSTGKQLRLVLDFDKRELWLEESADVMLLASNDIYGNGGALAATSAEKAAEEDAQRINAGPQAPRAAFAPVPGQAGQAQELYEGIKFRAVDAAHDDKPKTTGRGYVYLFGSQAERASVQLQVIGDDEPNDALSVVMAPLTGKASIASGAVALPRPKDDAEASEGEDNGN